MTEIATDLPLSCHIKDHCTAIECCLDLQSPLQQTIHFFMDLDLCLQTLKLGIENLTFETTLLAYKYGVVLFTYQSYQTLSLCEKVCKLFHVYCRFGKNVYKMYKITFLIVMSFFTGTQDYFRLADFVQIV